MDRYKDEGIRPSEVLCTGDAGKAYPLARVWSVGLNVNF